MATKKKAPPKIVMRRVDALKPNPKNTNQHPEGQLKKLAALIKRFGFTKPLLVRKDVIYAGHGAWLAAQRAGLTEVPTIELARLTVPQARALMIADNKIAELSKWDLPGLNIELKALADVGIASEPLGFNPGELAALERPAASRREADGKRAHRALIVRFADNKSVEDFAAALKIEIPPSSRYLWYPKD